MCDEPQPGPLACGAGAVSGRRAAPRDTAPGLRRHAPAARGWHRSSTDRAAARRSPAGTDRRRASAPSRHATRVTSGVTCGLPSRSPPIHDPKRIGAASSGSRRPVVRRERRIERAKVARQGVPERLLEDQEAARDFVERIGPSRPDLFGLPRRGDLARAAPRSSPRAPARSGPGDRAASARRRCAGACGSACAG